MMTYECICQDKENHYIPLNSEMREHSNIEIDFAVNGGHIRIRCAYDIPNTPHYIDILEIEYCPLCGRRIKVN